MSILDEFKTHPHTIFIAYSFVYIEQAINALKETSKKVEAIIIQPYREDMEFTSTIEAMRLYRELNNDQSIPILFTPQGRMSEDGQFFEYGARLLEVFNKEEITVIEKNFKADRWILPLDDTWPPYGQNFLIVKMPIVRLPERLPISVAVNVLDGPTKGKSVQAIAIPAPKRIQAEYEYILEIESFESVVDGKMLTQDSSASIEEDEATFPEGKELYRVHRSRERSSKVVEVVKRNRLTIDPLLRCEVCGFSFIEKYGELGKGFIEAHHAIPLSQQLGEIETKAEDIALVCPNCHRMLHRRRPWLDMPDLKTLMKL